MRAGQQDIVNSSKGVVSPEQKDTLILSPLAMHQSL